jgi:hypothetical protein
MRISSFVTWVALAIIGTACEPGKIELGDTGLGRDVGGDCPHLDLSTTLLEWTGTAAGTPAGQSLTVTNFCTGDGDLDIVSLVQGSAFQLNAEDLTLAPGESAEIGVDFNPSDYDLHEGVLSLSTNEPNTESYAISLSGKAQADMDGDGFEAAAAGGEDCDDADPSAYPGATEIWYDGIDQNCDGASDYDQDGDGFDHQDYGGEDCDDESPKVNPDANEAWYDGIDQNCDGASDYDQDGDGYEHMDHGGDDCNDTDPLSYPGAADKWYDGVDSDCAGNSDYDQDGDGGDADGYGGDDCDDFDASVFYDSGEIAQDGLDDDCDTLVDEDFLSAGDVLFSEFMMDPDEVSDSDGEWLEVYNVSSNDIDLIGWTINGTDGDSFTVADRTVVSTGGYAVLGTNSVTSTNGGVSLNYAYSYSQFKLNNDKDDAVLWMGALEMARVAYHKDDVDLKKGESINLDPAYLEQVYAEDLTYWCLASSRFGDGDQGTPGSENDPCRDNDFDGDGYSRNDGDCDESDASINPDAAESWDGVDNDCDGASDNMEIGDAAAGYLYGQSNDYLGFWQGLSMGDLDDDGQLDIIVGGAYTQGTYYAGGFHVIDGSAYSGFAGAAADNDYALVTGASYYNYMSYLPRKLGDQDNDGVDDLFVVASDTWYANYGNFAGGLFFGSSSFYGSLGIGDADVLFTGSGTAQMNHTSLSQLDVDGDGLDELFYGDFAHQESKGVLYGLTGASLVSGSTYDWPSDYDYMWLGADKNDESARGLSGGDVNGDGYDDLLVAAPYADQGSTDSGSVYLILGGSGSSSDSDPEREASVIFYGDNAQDYLSKGSTPVIGDFDEDGNQDVVIASVDQMELYFFSDASLLSGKVNTNTADAVIVGDGPAYFGLTMDVGDVDGDGEDDLVVGAPDYEQPYYANYYADEPGSVYLFTEDLAGYSFASDADARFTGANNSDVLGLAISVGDISGDGKDDILVASPAEWSTYGQVWILEAP